MPPPPGAFFVPSLGSQEESPCRALIELGSQKIILMTFHGSPLHSVALEAGVRFCWDRGEPAFAPLHLATREMLSLDPTLYSPAFKSIEDPLERSAMLNKMHLDFLGGFFETSLALHHALQSVDLNYTALPPCPELRPSRLLKTLSDLAQSAGGRHQLASELRFMAVGLSWYQSGSLWSGVCLRHRRTVI